jgi:hypothetical protein
MQSSATAPALLYLPHPCSRPLFLENLPNQCFAAYIFQSFPRYIKTAMKIADAVFVHTVMRLIFIF